MANANVRANGSVKDAIREFFAAERVNAEKIEKHRLGLSPDDDLPPYRHQDYPRALYAFNGESLNMITVENAAEEKAKLKAGYFASPAEAKKAAEITEAA